MRVIYLAIVIALAGCKQSERSLPQAEAAPPEPRSSGAPPAKEAASEDQGLDNLRKAASIAEAIAASKEIKGGEMRRALALGHWSRTHATWQELSVKESEASFGMVMKDVDAERGKRFCVSARVDFIRALAGEPKLYSAQVSTNQGHYVLLTARSTGSIVAPNNARFCAFVAGATEADVDGGVEYPMVYAVGAFDLPENRK